MSQIFRNLQIPIDENLEEKLEVLSPSYDQYRILRKSVDARKRRQPVFVYTVEVFAKGELPPDASVKLEQVGACRERPIIVGSGPAGLFAALRLLERGIRCILFERGSPSSERMKSINRFWRFGELDTQNNVCFGEGGAGLYSDGKLITRIKSPYIPYVLDRLVQFGAPEEIRYLANPHVGSDRIRRLIPVMRERLLSLGAEIHFDTQIERLVIESGRVTGVQTFDGKTFMGSHVVLATGHSARDMISTLHEQGVALEGKSFAMGLRIEHPQSVINHLQYREYAEDKRLGSANYRLAWHDSSSGIGVYSFCMCPGGYVLSSGTEQTGIVCNGMSNYHRNSPFANSAIVVSVDQTKLFGNDLFGGLHFQNSIETKAKQMVFEAKGTKELPAQTVTDFLAGRSTGVLKTSSPSGVVPARLDLLFPPWMTERLRGALNEFEKSMKGFIHPQAQLHGAETRTSSPVRIPRDPETLQSLSHPGLFPTGEGAGYAGGITSAACDGIRVAEQIVSELSSQATALVRPAVE